MKNTLYILTFLLAGISFETVAQDTLSKAEKKEIRKNKRSTKRYVHPKSVFIKIGGEFFFEQSENVK